MNLRRLVDRRLAPLRATRQLHGRRGSPLFGMVAGFLVGVLVAALVFVEHRDDETVAAGGTQAPQTNEVGNRELPVSGSGDPAAVPADGGAAPDGGASGRETTAGGEGLESGNPAQRVPAPDSSDTTPAARGVTNDKIRIGVALLDVGALRQLGPAFDNGDRRAHFESILASWRAQGLLPVHGRDVEFVYRSYGVLSQEEQRAACVGLVQDEKVFAVLGDSRFQEAGEECVAREFRTPMIAHDAGGDDLFARAHPFLFTVQASEDRLLRNLVHWADDRGVLDGRKIGIYYLDEPLARDQMNRTVKAELARLGHELAAEATTDQDLGGPQDALAVQRFRSAGVEIALLFTSKAGFMQQAEAQAYRPTYLESDHLSGTTNTATSTYPPEQFDGALGMTALRYGEWKAGIAAPAEARRCAEDYHEFSSSRVEPNAREAEWIALNKSCDVGRLLLRGLQQAGPALTPAGLVSAVQGLDEVPMGIAPSTSFGPERHHGVSSQRTVRWTADCRCWRAVGPFAPFFIR